MILTDEDVVAMRKSFRTGNITSVELAATRGITPKTALDAIKGISFKHVVLEPPLTYEEMCEIKSNRSQPKSHPKTRKAIVELLGMGLDKNQIKNVLVNNGTTMHVSTIYKTIKQLTA